MTPMGLKSSIFFLFLILLLGVTSASIEFGYDNELNPRVIMEEPVTAGISNVSGESVNDTTYWQGWTPTTYYDSIKLLFDATYCLLVGCTMQGDIDMNDNQILDAGNIISNENITADTYFGDWNGGNVDGNINILRSDNPSLTLVLSYIGGIARIGTDGNDNFRFITNGIDRVKIEEDGDMIVTNNITADTYFGDGSELTGISAGLWTNISDTATYNGNITTTGTRNQLGLNFWSCQLTEDSNLILTANLTKSIADGKC